MGNQVPARLVPIVRLTVGSDLLMWALKTFARPLTLRLVGFPRDTG
jgi:hypothetical protein